MTPSSADPGGPVQLVQSPKRIRAFLGGQLVADSNAVLLVWEVPYYPTYYFPEGDVRAELVSTGPRAPGGPSPDGSQAELFDVRTSSATATGAARRFPSSVHEELRRAVRLEWHAMDEWLEEDEPVYTHPRDPYRRVDILASSRHVRVEIDGFVIADSPQPRILFETGLPPRYYLPLTDYKMEYLRHSPSRSHCPYKGTASYFHVEVNGQLHKDLLWTYRTPLAESHKVAGLVAPYNEKVDLSLDGEVVARPRTVFS